MDKSEKSKLTGISILRIVAMLGVFMVHFGQRMGLSGYEFLYKITNFGQYGVQLFFVISGFLMIKSLDNCHSVKDVLKFYLKKGIRLLVLYFLVILWFFVSETFIFQTVAVTPDEYHLYWLRYIFLLNWFVPGYKAAGVPYLWANVGITWTIPLFLIAYLLTPILYKVCKINKSWKMSICFIVCLGLCVLQQLCFKGWLSFLGYYYTFVGGMLVYKCIQEGKQKSVAIISLIFIVGLMATQMFFEGQVTFVCMLLVMTIYDLPIKNKALLKCINVVDAHSYAIYLGHGIIFCSILDKFTLWWPIRLVVAIFGTVILVVALHNLYEKPVTKLLNKLLFKKKKVVSPTNSIQEEVEVATDLRENKEDANE